MTSQDAYRDWAKRFVAWYNQEHRHSGIRYVSPAERHAGQDHNVLARRHVLYKEARATNPQRRARHNRNWQLVGAVTLNPERESVVKAGTGARETNGFGRITQAVTTLTRAANVPSFDNRQSDWSRADGCICPYLPS